MQNVQVDKEFASLVEEIRQARDLHVIHGGILSNYVLKGPPKKYKGILFVRKNGQPGVLFIKSFTH